MPRHVLALLVAVLCATAAADDAPLPPGARIQFGDVAHRLRWGLFSADLSLDGNTIAWFDNGGSLTFTEVRTGKLTRTTNRPIGTGGRPAYTPDGKRFILYGTSEVLVWDPALPTPLVTVRPLRPVSATQT